jgi:hypothetical protein
MKVKAMNVDVLTGDRKSVDVGPVDVVLVDVVLVNVVPAKAPESTTTRACCAGIIAISVRQMIEAAKNFKVSFPTLFRGKFKDY